MSFPDVRGCGAPAGVTRLSWKSFFNLNAKRNRNIGYIFDWLHCKNNLNHI